MLRTDLLIEEISQVRSINGHQVRIDTWNPDFSIDANQSHKITGIRPADEQITIFQPCTLKIGIILWSILQLYWLKT